MSQKEIKNSDLLKSLNESQKYIDEVANSEIEGNPLLASILYHSLKKKLFDNYKITESLANLYSLFIAHLFQKYSIKATLIEKLINKLGSNEGIEIDWKNKEKFKNRFTKYLLVRVLKEEFSFGQSVEFEKLFFDFEIAKKIFSEISSNSDFDNLLKTTKQPSKLLNNSFFSTDLEKMKTETFDFEPLENFLKTLELENSGITKKMFREKWSQITKNLFLGVLTDFDLPNVKKNKSKKMRLLFPIFQIIDQEFNSMEIWEKLQSNEKDGGYGYKDYQSKKVGYSIGEKS